MTLNPIYTPASVEVAVVPASIEPSTGNPIARDFVERPAYEGSYTLTPTAEEQIIPTNGLRMTDNLTIAPIPSNYGLITWNGSVITVS